MPVYFLSCSCEPVTRVRRGPTGGAAFACVFADTPPEAHRLFARVTREAGWRIDDHDVPDDTGHWVAGELRRVTRRQMPDGQVGLYDAALAEGVGIRIVPFPVDSRSRRARPDRAGDAG